MKTGLSIGEERLLLFEDARPLPELRWAGRLWRRRSLSGLLDLVRSEEFAPETDVALRGAADEAPSGAGSSGVLSRVAASASSASADVAADGPGFLLFSRTFFPAWKARIDGVPAPVLVGNGRDLAVPVAAGRHRVEIRYDPAPFRAGVALQAGALLIGLAAAGARKR